MAARYTAYGINVDNLGEMVEAFALAVWSTPPPPAVRARAERILDRAARRLLAEQVDRDSIGATAGCDCHARNRRPDEVALLIEREPVPIGSDEQADTVRAA